MARTRQNPEEPLPFGEAAGLLKALGHPLRLRLICGLSREPSNLTRIVQALNTPLSTVALHLGVLRRTGILREERRGAEVLFGVKDDRVPKILAALCTHEPAAPPGSWDWKELAQTLHETSI
jgi:DNA-binding transcriptional ArsR family regulator